jgi:hypothetical protein
MCFHDYEATMGVNIGVWGGVNSSTPFYIGLYLDERARELAVRYTLYSIHSNCTFVLQFLTDRILLCLDNMTK